MVITVHGFLLKKLNPKEDDVTISILTLEKGVLYIWIPHGKKSQKRGGRQIEFLKELELTIHISPNQKYILREARIINDYTELSHDLSAYFAYCYVVELINLAILTQYPVEELYYSFKDFVSNLALKESPIIETTIFQYKLLTILGWSPELKRCYNCNLPIEQHDKVYLSPEKGGILCSKCYNNNHHSFDPIPTTLLISLFTLNHKYQISYDKNYLVLFVELNKFIEYYLEKKISSFKMTYEQFRKIVH